MTTTPVTTASAATVSTWNIDPAHSAAEFKVKHMMISNVKGKFTGLSGTLALERGRSHPLHGRGNNPRRHLDHRRRAARRTPEKRRLLRRGKVSHHHVQVLSVRLAGPANTRSPAN